MDQAYDTSSNVELITPARFLFNAGQIPKAWNKKMPRGYAFKSIVL